MPPSPLCYEHETAVLATMHGKQVAVGPPFREILGLKLRLPDDIDTDALGTFTGEVERKGTMLETAIAKARLGMELTGSKLGLASEGSYGPHPVAPLSPPASSFSSLLMTCAVS